MSTASNRGFSLVELLVCMVLLGIVTGSVTSAAISAVRTADRSRERARQEGMLREVAAVVERELGDVAPARDVGVAEADSIRYRAPRGSGYTCGVEGGAIVVRDADYRAWRLPDPARDSLLLLVPDDSLLGAAHWAVTPLLAMPARGHCRDGAPALRLSVDPLIVALASSSDMPLRVVEWMRIRLYESAGSWWVGAGSLRPGDVIQPIAGPLLAGGLSFAWLGNDAAAVPPAGAVVLELRLAAATSAPAGPGRGMAADTLRTLIALRNGGAP
jgi:prepilin-type N-terminal cleavage/methylation domain-containing protein